MLKKGEQGTRNKKPGTSSLFCILYSFPLLLVSCTTSHSTQTVITNARVWTANPDQPWAESIAIDGSDIFAVGSNEKVEALIDDNAAHLDGGGGMIVPGFIDAHVHFITGGFRLSSVQLRDAGSPEVFAQRIAEFAQSLEPGEWILGGDWDHEQWGGELPNHGWIDEVTPNNPVWVNRLDGHMALANSLALEAAGVTAETEDPFGGAIVRDAAGKPTGVLKDNAMNLIASIVPDPSSSQEDRALDTAMAYVNQQGVTSVHHMGTIDQLDAFERAKNAGRLTTRIYAATQLNHWKRLKDKVDAEGTGDEWVRLGGLKGFVDGSLGSHTAAFFEPFADEPDNSGLFVTDPERLYDWIKNADNAGLQPIVHAIGDRAIHELLNIFERVAGENGPRDRRFRIEHAQHILPADIPRFGELAIIPSMQPYHAIDDGRWAERVIGPDRIETTYAFRSLLDTGARPAFGSDWFVAPPTPLEGIYAAVTRSTLDDANPHGWVPAQKITVEEALRAYTIDAAFASFEENIKGSLEPGKRADLVLIDRDLTEIPPEELQDAKIRMTMVDGVVVFEE